MEQNRNGATILVVDDEQPVAELTRDILLRFGYKVIISNSGEDALALYKRQSAEIGMVLLDMVMPGMAGAEIYRSLRAINPVVKVLLASGYSQDRDAEGLLTEGAAGFIQKPYRINDLIKAINKVGC